jgi:putative phosphoesterase
MRIGVLSDTHDHLPAIRAALDRFARRGLHTVVHAGDIVAPFAARLLATWPGELVIIYGNNDGERSGLKSVLPQIQDGPLFITRDSKTILVHHFIDWCRPEDVSRAHFIITGHTHEYGVTEKDGRLFLNPGECCGWVTGHGTAAVLDLDNRQVERIEITP